MRSFDLGPFQVFRLQKNDNDEWSNIEFSSCGKFVLVSTKGEVIKWVDAFTGVVVHEFKGHKNPNVFLNFLELAFRNFYVRK